MGPLKYVLAASGICPMFFREGTCEAQRARLQFGSLIKPVEIGEPFVFLTLLLWERRKISEDGKKTMYSELYK